MTTSEILVNMKKDCEALQMELKRIDSITKQGEMATKTRDAIIKEIRDLKENKKGIEDSILKEQAERIEQLNEREKAIHAKELALEEKRQQLDLDLHMFKNRQVTLALSLEKAKKDQDEARETTRAFKEKIVKLQVIAG